MSRPKSDRGAARQIVRALRRAGWNMVCVTYEDGEEIPVRSDREAFNDLLFEADDAWVTFAKDDDEGWVYFVWGNSPEEAANDWTLNLSDTMDPLVDGWL